ncbi:MAG: HAD-IA family hydrolase [Spirochaetales bacterium]
MIKNLLFDMDNTLYSETNRIDIMMNKRIIRFVADFFHVPVEEARQLRIKGLKKYGTTVEWLRTDHNFRDMSEYFESVHPDYETDEVEYDPRLRPFLQILKKVFHLSVLTNAPKIHASRILRHLNITDLFDGIYDLESNNFLGKPHKDAYLKAIEEQEFTVSQTLFFDDHPSYVKGFTDIGGKGVLIDPFDVYENNEFVQQSVFARIKTIYEIPTLLKSMKNNKH